MSQLLTPAIPDYELIDSGDFEKLERFGRYVTRRPEPQAIWHRSLSEDEWRRIADASFLKTSSAKNDERGEWQCKAQMPDRWSVEYNYKQMHLKMRLALTSFKHVGIFPEQAANWNFIYDTCREKLESKGAKPKVLNLFAYTGGATLAAAASGADVTHVDSVKQVVTWSRENMESSKFDGIRWIVEDALKFVQREVRRGNRYDGIILDPPAYGRGANGEKWVLEQNIAEMLEACAQLLAEDGFLVLNLYSMGLSSTIARTLVRQTFGTPKKEEFGELFFTDRAGKELPFGTFYRMKR